MKLAEKAPLGFSGRLLNKLGKNLYVTDELRTVGVKQFFYSCETPAKVELMKPARNLSDDEKRWLEIVQADDGYGTLNEMELAGSFAGGIDLLRDATVEMSPAVREERALLLKAAGATIHGLPRKKNVFAGRGDEESFYGIVPYGVALVAAILGYESLDYLLVPVLNLEAKREDEMSCMCRALMPAKFLRSGAGETPGL